jgi:hypothetical protein
MPTSLLSHDELLLCLRQAPAFLAAFDRCGKIVFASAAAYGHTPQEVLGASGDAHLVPEDRAAWWAAFCRARDAREKSRCRVRVRGPEPPGVFVHAVCLTPVLDPGARPVVRFVCALAEDVTHGPPCAGDAPAPAAAGLPPRPPGVPAGARWLSPLGERVVAFLAGRGRAWTPAEAIAKALGEVLSHRLRNALAGLAERGILETHAGLGYRLAE